MKTLLLKLVLFTAMIAGSPVYAQSGNSTTESEKASFTPEKPADVPDKVWEQFIASIFTEDECRNWSAETALLAPHLNEKQIANLVEAFFPHKTIHIFEKYKNRKGVDGCKKDDRFVCVIIDCDQPK